MAAMLKSLKGGINVALCYPKIGRFVMKVLRLSILKHNNVMIILYFERKFHL
jgi:hypothetical protein